MKYICVYCGSSLGNDLDFGKTAEELGKLLAAEEITLIYGGSKIGLMGITANACLKNGGEVIGVIPKFLDHVEISNTDIAQLIMTETMHERKTKMAEMADGFIALPGGFGTLEELSEILTWGQLGLIKKPIGILNINGFYDKLLELFDHMNQRRLLKTKNLELFVTANIVKDLFAKMQNFNHSNTSFRDKLGLT